MSRRATRLTAVGDFNFSVKLFINEMSRDVTGFLNLLEIKQIQIKSISVTKQEIDDVFKVSFWDGNSTLMFNTTIQLNGNWNAKLIHYF